MAEEAWRALPKERADAYQAFTFYYRLPPHNRSIDKAYRAFLEWEIRQRADFDPARDRAGIDSAQNGRAPGTWRGWSQKYRWVARALAHDEFEQAQIDREWEERKRQWREENWQIGQQIRGIIGEALPEARQFIRSRTIRVGGGENGQPTEIIRIMAFDMSALVASLERAVKIQGQALEVPSERVLHLYGQALDDTIEASLRELADLIHSGAASPPPQDS